MEFKRETNEGKINSLKVIYEGTQAFVFAAHEGMPLIAQLLIVSRREADNLGS